MSISSSSRGLRPGVCTSTTRPTNPYEGMIIYETDTDMLAIWNGSTWRYVAATTPTTGAVLQIARTTDTTQRTTTSGSWVDTNVNVTITPKASTSTVMVVASFLGITAKSGTGNNLSTFRLTDSSNNALSGAETVYFGSEAYTLSNGYFYSPVTMIGWANPGTTSAVTYKMRYAVASSSTVYVSGNYQTTQLFAIELSA